MASAAELAQLKAALSNLLGLAASGALLQLNSNACERAYEAYVFALCCEAVRAAGGTVDIVGINSGPSPNPIVFRGAPGSLASTSQNFAYARCRLDGKQFEFHVDVEYQGTSGALHEIDVSMCDSRYADVVRSTAATPKAHGNKLIMAFECKFYESTPGVALGRTFVGLISDCANLRMKAFASNLPSNKLRVFFSKATRPQPFLDLNPLNAATERRFISNVEQGLLHWAGRL